VTGRGQGAGFYARGEGKWCFMGRACSRQLMYIWRRVQGPVTAGCREESGDQRGRDRSEQCVRANGLKARSESRGLRTEGVHVCSTTGPPMRQGATAGTSATAGDGGPRRVVATPAAVVADGLVTRDGGARGRPRCPARAT